MWDFPQFTFGERAFSSLSWGFLEAAKAGAGARAGAQASKTTLKIRCKLSSEYLGILVAAAGNFDFGGLLGYLENSDLGDKEEPKKETKEEGQ